MRTRAFRAQKEHSCPYPGFRPLGSFYSVVPAVAPPYLTVTLRGTVSVDLGLYFRLYAQSVSYIQPSSNKHQRPGLLRMTCTVPPTPGSLDSWSILPGGILSARWRQHQDSRSTKPEEFTSSAYQLKSCDKCSQCMVHEVRPKPRCLNALSTTPSPLRDHPSLCPTLTIFDNGELEQTFFLNRLHQPQPICFKVSKGLRLGCPGRKGTSRPGQRG